MKSVIYSQEAPKIPAGVFYLKRLHIRKLLKKALQSPVVTISAAEGYGKTWSVYSSLLNSDSINFWIRITEQDNNAEHLWAKKTGTISLFNPRLGGRLAEMGFPDTRDLFERYHLFLERVITREKKIVLVYDDFHLIRNAEILDFLNRYLAFPIPNISTILVYRGEPDINHVSLLSKGFLTRINEDDLRFSREETAKYFKGRHISLEEDDLDHIYRSTEGWPLLLDLIAREAEDKKPGEKAYSPELMKERSAKLIEDGFFSALSGDMQKLLIKFSLIDHRPRELLEKMGLRKELVANMDNIGPMIRYDSYRHGYRFQRILLEYLRERQGELSPEEIRQVYACAAAWHLENGRRTEATRYYDRAGDYHGVFNMIYSFPGLMPAKTAAFFTELIGRHLEEEGDEGEEYLIVLRYIVRPKLIFALGRFKEAAAECRRIIKQFECLPLNSLNVKIIVMNYIYLASIAIFSSRFTGEYRFLPVFEAALYYYEKNPFYAEGSLTKCGIPSYICQVGYPAKKDQFEFSIRKLAAAEPYAVKILNGYLCGTESLAWTELYYFKGDIDAAGKYARQAVF
ncbi:MAG: hypothetical protein LBH26_02135, partial [Treponema sp.]|nr:hypothetical protein [Treponema sp.]